MSFNIPTSLATRSVSCRHMTREDIQRIYDTPPFMPIEGGTACREVSSSSYPSAASLSRTASTSIASAAPEILSEPWDVWGVNDDLDQADYDECEEDGIFADAAAALTRLPPPQCTLPSCTLATRTQSCMPSVDYHDEDQSLSRGPLKRETIEDYCFGMDFTESFVPAASSVLQRPLPVPGTPKYENYRYDLPLRRLEPTPGTVEHKEYMYDAISALLEKTRSLNHRAGEEEDAETNTLCQNVEKILENWSGFDVVPHDFDEVNPDCWWKQEYEAALEGDAGPLCIEELREYEFDEEEDREDEEEEEEDDGFQEPTEYEKENENELYMWGGLK